MGRAIKRINPMDVYRSEVKEVLQKLPEGWRKDFYGRNPQYDTRDWSKRLENVVIYRSSDAGLLKAMQNLQKWYARKATKAAKGERHD